MKIAILDRSTLGYDTPLDKIEELGEVLSYDTTTQSEIYERTRDVEVIIVNKIKITRDIIKNAERLKLICVFATGYDNIDVCAASEFSVGVCNVPGYSTQSVALFTVATVLALVTHLKEYNRYVTSGEYSRSTSANRLIPVYNEIYGRTWGIIGYGNIGRVVGNAARSLGAKVIVNKKHDDPTLECVSVDELCRLSDIITIHCPLNDETRALINESRISLMKKNVIIVNSARGAVLCEDAIARAVIEGRIGAFGSDVYAIEPFGKDHPYTEIMERDNVLLTPHCAWGAYEARERCAGVIADNIKAYFSGKILNRVDITGQN